MTKPAEENSRRCIATGARGDRSGLIRFVVGPDGILVPDLGEKLPGRGLWLAASQEALAMAAKKKAFQRAMGGKAVEIPVDLAATLIDGVRRRISEGLGLARRAGQTVTGFEKVKARLEGGSVGVLLHAADGAEGGLQKLGPAARQLVTEGRFVEGMTAAELGLPFDRDQAVHVAVDEGKLASRIMKDGIRLDGLLGRRKTAAPKEFGPKEARSITE